MKIWVYRCTNGACRMIIRRGGMRKIHQTCPECGHVMVLISTEDE